MNGGADGWIYSTTNLEFFSGSLVFLLGASLFIGFISQVATEWTLRNIQSYENNYRYEHAKQFCEIRNLPMGIRLKIRYFYYNIRMDFDQYNDKNKMLQELPYSLQGQIALLFNSQVLKNVKFLQMAQPEFITKVACKLFPEVCLTGDFIVRYHEIADKMYFVQNGSFEVLATDHFTTIAFLGEGAYFGEIGVLITGKRSVSVKALSNCMTYAVKSQDFLQILAEFPEQTKFLRAVGYQRLQSTDPEDVISHRSQNIIHQSTVKSVLEDRVFPESGALSNRSNNYDRDISFLRLNTMPDSKKLQNDKIRTKFWLTKQYSSLEQFIIMPFSGLFYLWNAIMILVFSYVLFIVPYGIGFQEDFGFDATLIVCQIVYAIDIPLRMRLGITEPNRIVTDLQQVFDYYINSWLFFDMLATIPVEYVLQVYYPVLSRWIMLLKLLKAFRLQETLQIYLQNTNFGQFFVMFAVYMYMLAALTHLSTCGFAYIALQNINGSSRFDGQSFISNYAVREYGEGNPDQFNMQDKYSFFLYYASTYAAGQGYGDMAPFTDTEIYATLIITLLGRLLLSFAFSETSQYLGEIYKSQSRKLMNTSYLNSWMRQIKLPKQLIVRIKEFNSMQWRFQHQIDENEILEGLPPTLQNDIKSNLFAPLIRNWEAISKENIGEVMSIVNELDLVTYPENEYIVKIGEVADDMYFIIDGLCQVLQADGTEVAIMKQGQNFGEMALLDPEMPLRMASVKSLTTVNLAVMTRTKFESLSILFPQFKENIAKMVRQRLRNYLTGKHAEEGNMRVHILQRLQKSESISEQSSVSEGLTDSDFDQNQENFDISIHDDEEEKKSDLVLKKFGDSQTPSKSTRANGNLRNNNPFKKTNQRNSPDRLQTNSNENLETERKLIDRQPLSGHKQNQRQSLRKSKVSPAPQKSTTDMLSHRQKSFNNSNKSKNVNKMGLKRSTTQQTAQSISDQFSEMNQTKQKFLGKLLISKLNWKSPLKFLVQLAVHYNVWFIPIHTAYKFPFEGIWLGLEAATIVIYGFELVYRFYKYKHLKKINQLQESSLSIKDRKLKQDYEKLLKKISIQRSEFILTLLAIIPLNLIFERTHWPSSLIIQTLVMTLRLVKYRPLPKLFEKLQTINLPLFRVLQVLYYNYIVSNWYSSIWINMVIDQKDARTNWLRRLPVPQQGGSGIRTDPNYRGDISPFSLYIYSQYYIQGTLSHVAIGEITPTNGTEWMFNSIFMWSSTFIYCYLFSNIASIVSNLTSEIHVSFLKKRNLIITKLKNDMIPPFVVDEVNLYFNYQFSKYNGLSEQELTGNLPDRIKLDISLAQYSSVIKSSLLFKKLDGEFDQTLANTVLRTMKKQIFLKEQFITKVGQTFTDSMIILEGSINVCSFMNNENLGLLGPGDFFGTDLFEQTNAEIDRNYFQYTQGEGQPKVKLGVTDNLESRSMVHLISKTFVVVGFLTKSDAKILYKAYPEIKKIFKFSNRYLFDVGRKQVEKRILHDSREQATRDSCLKKVKESIAYGTKEMYEQIVANQRITYLYDIKNLTYIIKNYYIISQKEDVRKLLYSACFGKIKQQPILPAKEQGSSCCCEDQFIEEDSKMKIFLQYLHLFNLIYTSMALPFYIGFNIRIRGPVLFIEIISSFISLMIFLLNFRTPYIENGEKSVEFYKVAGIYLKNGMVVDFFGMLPLNIILDFLVDLVGKKVSISTCCLVGVFRCTRMFSIMQAVTIFEIIKLQFKKQKFLIQTSGNLLFCFIVGHWIVCLWVFTILIIEQHDPNNWWFFQKLDKKATWSVYIQNWYAVLNITTGAGLGDIYAVTDLERTFFVFMMNCGDIVFALAFGLITQIAYSSRLDDETGNFIKQMVKVERILAKFEISNTWKDRVEQFFTYQQKIQTSAVDLNSTELEKHLPRSLVRKILYHQYKELVRPLFKEYESENLISDICYYLKSKIYMPDDMIMNRGEEGTELFFVVEGAAQFLAADNSRVINKLGPGAYVGDVATFNGKPRNFSVRAKSFCLLKVISKQDLEEVFHTYPEIYQDMKLKANAKHTKQVAMIKAPQILANQLSDDVLNLLGVTGVNNFRYDAHSVSNSSESKFDSEQSDAKPSKAKYPSSNIKKSSFDEEDAINYIDEQLLQMEEQKIGQVQETEESKNTPQSVSPVSRRMKSGALGLSRVPQNQLDFEVLGQHSERLTKRKVEDTQLEQPSERPSKRKMISEKDEEQDNSEVDDSLVSIEPPTTNKSKRTVRTRLSSVSIGRSLSITPGRDGRNVQISVNQ